MHGSSDREGVSPVIAVTLLVAITVAASVSVGVFVFDLGESEAENPNSVDLSVKTFNENGDLIVKVWSGSSDELRILKNNTEIANLSNPKSGDILSVNITPDTEYSVVSIDDNSTSLVATYNSQKIVSIESNSPPIAYATANDTTVYERETVNFDASGSSDDDGNIISYEWDFQSDGTYDATGITVNHSYTTAGTYDAIVTVTDSKNESTSDTITIEVSGSTPVADIYANQTSIVEGETVAFDGNNSSDADGDTLSYEWDFTTDGTIDATGISTTHSYTAEGTYNATLIVTDETGNSDKDNITITVSNAAPTALMSANQTDIYDGDTVAFDGSNSSDPGGDSLSYDWDFTTDGTIDATGATTTHTYSSTGTYTATLNVTDTSGATDSDNITITVSNAAPDALVSANRTTVYVGDDIEFDGSNSSDPDGDSLTYEWDFQSDGTVDATGVTAVHSYSSSGTYNATLIVTDSDGVSREDGINITVDSPTLVDDFEDGQDDGWYNISSADAGDIYVVDYRAMTGTYELELYIDGEGDYLSAKYNFSSYIGDETWEFQMMTDKKPPSGDGVELEFDDNTAGASVGLSMGWGNGLALDDKTILNTSEYSADHVYDIKIVFDFDKSPTTAIVYVDGVKEKSEFQLSSWGSIKGVDSLKAKGDVTDSMVDNSLFIDHIVRK